MRRRLGIVLLVCAVLLHTAVAYVEGHPERWWSMPVSLYGFTGGIVALIGAAVFFVHGEGW